MYANLRHETQAPVTPSQFAKEAISIEETSARFSSAGVPRSVRTIQRYCQVGYLNCISVQGEIGSRYLVSAESAENRIRELQQVQTILSASASAPGRDTARQDATQRVETRHDASHRDELNAALKRIDDLEAETRTLEIDKRVRQGMIEQMQRDRERLLDDLRRYVETMNDQSRQIGRLEARAAQLSAPVGEKPQDGEGARVVE